MSGIVHAGDETIIKARYLEFKDIVPQWFEKLDKLLHENDSEIVDDILRKWGRPGRGRWASRRTRRRTHMNPHISRQNQKIDVRNVVIWVVTSLITLGYMIKLRLRRLLTTLLNIGTKTIGTYLWRKTANHEHIQNQLIKNTSTMVDYIIGLVLFTLQLNYLLSLLRLQIPYSIL